MGYLGGVEAGYMAVKVQNEKRIFALKNVFIQNFEKTVKGDKVGVLWIVRYK